MKAFLKEHLKVIDRYIIKKYLGTFVFTIGIFIVITVVFDVSEHLDNFLKAQTTMHDIIFEYYAGFVPFYMNMLSPLINFLAVIFFTAQMANKTEIVPILSGKVSFNRFLRPYFIASTLIFIVAFFANVYLIPYTNKLKIAFENQHINDVDPTKSEVHMQLDKHTYVFLQSYDNSIKTGYTFIMEKFNGDTLREKLLADRIVFDSVKHVWSIKNYTVRHVNGLKEGMEWRGISKDTTLDMRPSDFEVHDNIYSAMSLSTLNKNIEKAKIRGTGELTDLRFEKYHRFIYPLSTYVLTLIGVSISSRKVRGGIGLPLGIGILLCFSYIIVERFALVFSIKGGLTPIVAVFIPNVLFGILGYYLLLKAPK